MCSAHIEQRKKTYIKKYLSLYEKFSNFINVLLSLGFILKIISIMGLENG